MLNQEGWDPGSSPWLVSENEWTCCWGYNCGNEATPASCAPGRHSNSKFPRERRLWPRVGFVFTPWPREMQGLGDSSGPSAVGDGWLSKAKPWNDYAKEGRRMAHRKTPIVFYEPLLGCMGPCSVTLLSLKAAIPKLHCACRITWKASHNRDCWTPRLGSDAVAIG